MLDNGAKVILCSHLGRPGGTRNSDFSLKVVASRLGELIGKNVSFVEDCVGEKVNEAIDTLSESEVLLLENVRFYHEETELKSLRICSEFFVDIGCCFRNFL